MSEKRFIITFETVIKAEDLWEAVNIGNELKKKYEEDKLELKGVMVYGDVE